MPAIKMTHVQGILWSENTCCSSRNVMAHIPHVLTAANCMADEKSSLSIVLLRQVVQWCTLLYHHEPFETEFLPCFLASLSPTFDCAVVLLAVCAGLPHVLCVDT